MRVDKEIIYHYICDECDNWWSYATSEAYEPKVMFCPHCGHRDEIHPKNKEL